MEIKFEHEDNLVFAIAQKEIYRGKFHDELMFSEIVEEGGLYIVRWEDSWNTARTFSSLDAAKTYVVMNYMNHVPYSNGNSYEIEEK